MRSPPPPLVSLDDVVGAVRAAGWAVLGAPDVGRLAGVDVPALDALAASWDALPPDPWLKDGGRYRRRRHASLVVDDSVDDGAADGGGPRVQRVAHRAHWQPVDYNALHGGLLRWFDPMVDDVVDHRAFVGLVGGLAGCASAVFGRQRWFVEAHQFRIDTTDGIGRPTPEGAHRDGVDFVAVVLVARRGVKGGETRVFAADGPAGVRFTLVQPWSTLLLDDARVIHESTPIQPDGDVGGYRDSLVLTFRRGGFQDPPVVV
jgi:hypothetical protein